VSMIRARVSSDLVLTSGAFMAASYRPILT